MPDVTPAILKLAQKNPKFRRLLAAEIKREAASPLSDARFWELVKAFRWPKMSMKEVKTTLFEEVKNLQELAAFQAALEAKANELVSKTQEMLGELPAKDLQDEKVANLQRTVSLTPWVFADLVLQGGKLYNECMGSAKDCANAVYDQAPTNYAKTHLLSRRALQEEYNEFQMMQVILSEEASKIVDSFGDAWKGVTNRMEEDLEIIRETGKGVEKFLAAWAGEDLKAIKRTSADLPGTLAKMEVAIEEFQRLSGQVAAMQKMLDGKLLTMLRRSEARVASTAKTAAPIPGAWPATVAELQVGDNAALFSHSTTLQRVRRIVPAPRGNFRVTWDHGPNTKLTTRVMPGSNPVQVMR